MTEILETKKQKKYPKKYLIKKVKWQILKWIVLYLKKSWKNIQKKKKFLLIKQISWITKIDMKKEIIPSNLKLLFKQCESES